MTVKAQKKPEWLKARNKPKHVVRQSELADIFKGQARLEEADISGINVVRISAYPEGSKSVPQSFAVENQSIDWKVSDRSELPYGFQWQQSREARFDFHFDLPEDVRCFGLGERYSGLNLRSKIHTLCTSDHKDHSEALDPMYVSIPFVILYTRGKSYGLFIDSPAPQRWDLDSELEFQGAVRLFSRKGWSAYLFGPGDLSEIVRAYTELTGRTKLPPEWSLGYIQCRWSYPDEKTVRNIGKEFRSRKIPCDALVLDIDYMDEYRVFTHSTERFPNFTKMIEDLNADKFKVVTIVDPGIKKDDKYKIYSTGKKKDLFCKTPDGKTFIDIVWPGDSAFPDFLRDETRSWWADNLKFYVENGVSGIWNDMNEPSFFSNKTPFPDNVEELPGLTDQYFLQESPEGPVGHLEVRNLYGHNMSKATREGLLRHRPDERPFVLTRSGYAGIQRYAAVWTGDNMSWFEHLEKSIPMLLNLGLSGVPFVGADVGGFGGDSDPELLVRWYELAIFYPFFRNHSAAETRSQEPWAFNERVEKKLRYLIGARYRLLPYLRRLFYEHMTTGAPLMRPLVWHYGNNPVCHDIQDQFLLGSDIMVAPVVKRGASQRLVFMPDFPWYPMEGGPAFTGGSSYMVKRPLGTMPAFARHGCILPLGDENVECAEDLHKGPVTFVVYGRQATSDYYEDDGRSNAYEKGEYNHWRLEYNKGDFSVETIHKGYQSEYKPSYKLYADGKESAVELP